MNQLKYKYFFLIILNIALFVSVILISFNLSQINLSLEIVTLFKIPKAATAFFSGGILSLCGLLLQNLLRNPLAEPHILGIQSGSSFFIILYIFLVSRYPNSDLLINSQFSLPFIFSLFGALISTFFLVFTFKLVKNNNNILIVGILLSILFNALTSFTTQWLESQGVQAFLNWTYGSFENASTNELLLLMCCSLILITILLFFSKHLDLFSLGERTARSLGLDTKSVSLLFIMITSICTGLICSLCGPIGFVGFISPHLAKILFKTGRHSVLILGSYFSGSAVALCLQLISDLFSPMPINLSTVSGILSVPFIIIYILKENKKRYA